MKLSFLLLLIGVHFTFAAQADVYLTTTDQSYLFQQLPSITFSSGNVPNGNVITISTNTRYQNMTGFGAALTESSAFVLSLLRGRNATAYNLLMTKLFDPIQGIGISALRFPMGSCDFTIPPNFSYDEVSDPVHDQDWNLQNFNLNRDVPYRIPVLQNIVSIIQKASTSLMLIGTPWSPPLWMKTSYAYGSGSLISSNQIYQTYANYFVKFLESYSKFYGITFTHVTMQNEPLFQPNSYPGCYLSPSQEIQFLGYLYPALQSSAVPNTQVLIYDHNWDNYYYPLQILNTPSVYNYVGGTAFHCYGGTVSLQMEVYNQFPAKPIHTTECSGGAWAPNFGDNLVWDMQNLYMGSPLNFGSSVLLWNLALDENDGPTNNGCTNCRGVITVSNSSMRLEDIVFNVEYYVIAHLSKFVRPGAVRVAFNLQNQNNNLLAVGFVVEQQNRIVAVVLNSGGSSQNVVIVWNNQWIQFSLPPGVATFTWTY